MKRNSFIVVKPIAEVTNMDVPVTTSRWVKEHLVRNAVNPRKYDFLGFVDRTNEVLLGARYHNVRDHLGRFTSI